MRLLLLEDDPTLGEGLQDFLQSDGYVVDWCTSIAQAKTLVNEPYDAWLLDWQLPDGSGLDWLARQRQAGLRTQAFLLTPGLVRLAVGIEHIDDIFADLTQGFAASAG